MPLRSYCSTPPPLSHTGTHFILCLHRHEREAYVVLYICLCSVSLSLSLTLSQKTDLKSSSHSLQQPGLFLCLSRIQTLAHKPFSYYVCAGTVYLSHTNPDPTVCCYRYGHEAKVVHFLGKVKPWNYSYDTQRREVKGHSLPADLRQMNPDYLLMWWELYSKSVLPLLQQAYGDTPFNTGCTQVCVCKGVGGMGKGV